MINGTLGQWISEAQQHWHHLAAAFGTAMATPQLIHTAVVAVVTAVLTSQVTMARLDERIIAMRNEYAVVISKRNEQVADIKRDIVALETREYRILERLTVLEAMVLHAPKGK